MECEVRVTLRDEPSSTRVHGLRLWLRLWLWLWLRLRLWLWLRLRLTLRLRVTELDRSMARRIHERTRHFQLHRLSL